MLKKITYSAGIAFSILILLFTSASAAISFVYSEGVWGRVDDGYDGIKFDVVGVIGVDPGTAWGSGSKTTADDTLTRNATVCTHNPDGDAALSEWTGTSPAVYTGLGSHTIDTTACTYQGLFISEYIEGEGNPGNDAIEIYNNMGQDVDLSDFSIQIYNGGSSTPSVDIPLDGYTILKDNTFVIVRTAITGVTADLTTGNLSFSGDDAVALVRDYIDDTNAGWWDNNGPDGENDGAESLLYTSGPTGLNPQLITHTYVTSTNPSIQNTTIGDWNQVRYGDPAGNPDTFYYQSGLAFQGITTAENAEFEEDQAFLAGKFCHINNPIYADDAFTYSNLTLDLYEVDCGTGAVAPYPPQRMTFVYPVTLEETNNSGTCVYPSTTPCADVVEFGAADAEFTCFYEGNVENTYKVVIVGFIPVEPDGNCSDVTYPQGGAGSTGIFISDEGSTNCGCLFAMVTESNPTAVELISFTAESIPEGVKLSWETATETDNLGFNLYRSDSLTSDKVQLNDTLIPPNVPPGSPFGATYEFVDTGATAFQTYFYWLEDIDASGEITLHGPAIVTRP